MAFSEPLALHTTAIEGLFIIDLSVHGDNRGWFKEHWQREKFRALTPAEGSATPTPQSLRALHEFEPIQQNISFNASAGVTRGLHAEPWDKYVSVATGRVFGAWCDLREGSPTFGEVVTCELAANRAAFVPRGVANGFQALDEATAYTYLVNAHWSPDAQYSFVNFHDPALGIDWPLQVSECSQKDREHPPLEHATPVRPKQVLVLGASGQLGAALRRVMPDARFLSREQWDITSLLQATPTLPEVDFSNVGVIINAAAYTAVDQAEQERAAAWAINASAVGALARLANEHQITLVHVSSDYVFDGSAETHSEEEAFSPLGVYGQSKAAGDLAAMSARRHLIVRTSWVVGAGRNFVATMAELAARGVNPQVVDDQVGRVCFAEDLAHAVVHLLNTGAAWGTYNVSNAGTPASWAEVAKEVFRQCGADPARVQPVSTAEYFAGREHAPRPRWSTLELGKLEAAGYYPRDWRAALGDYLRWWQTERAEKAASTTQEGAQG